MITVSWPSDVISHGGHMVKNRHVHHENRCLNPDMNTYQFF